MVNIHGDCVLLAGKVSKSPTYPTKLRYPGNDLFSLLSLSLSTQTHTHLMNWLTSYETLQLQFQNDMHLPLMMGGAQESQPLSWLPDNENQHIILPDGTNFLPQR